MRSSIKGWRGLARTAALLSTLALLACAQPGVAVDPGVVATTPDRTAVIAVEFDFGSHRIRPEYYGPLDAVAGAMASQELAGYHFDVDGHTDIIGRLSYNIALSNLRAQAVVNYLASRGVPRSSMRAQGFGPLNLLDPYNPTSPVNRRVEVTSIR